MLQALYLLHIFCLLVIKIKLIMGWHLDMKSTLMMTSYREKHPLHIVCVWIWHSGQNWAFKACWSLAFFSILNGKHYIVATLKIEIRQMYGKFLATMKDLEYCFKTSFMMLRAIFKQLLSLSRRKPKFDFLVDTSSS